MSLDRYDIYEWAMVVMLEESISWHYCGGALSHASPWNMRFWQTSTNNLSSWRSQCNLRLCHILVVSPGPFSTNESRLAPYSGLVGSHLRDLHTWSWYRYLGRDTTNPHEPQRPLGTRDAAYSKSSATEGELPRRSASALEASIRTQSCGEA